MHRLDVPLRRFLAGVTRLDGLVQSVGTLPAVYQKIAAEIVLLRMFELQLDFFRGVAVRLACGAAYMDGSTPLVVNRSTTVGAAETAMKSLGRAKPVSLRWSKAAFIARNVRHVLDPADHFVRSVQLHAGDIDEVRRVRNRIAHNNSSSRSDFRHIVRRYYGGAPNSVTPGILLLTPRQSPVLIDVYLRRSQILAKAVTRS